MDRFETQNVDLRKMMEMHGDKEEKGEGFFKIGIIEFLV